MRSWGWQSLELVSISLLSGQDGRSRIHLVLLLWSQDSGFCICSVKSTLKAKRREGMLSFSFSRRAKNFTNLPPHFTLASRPSFIFFRSTVICLVTTISKGGETVFPTPLVGERKELVMDIGSWSILSYLFKISTRKTYIGWSYKWW